MSKEVNDEVFYLFDKSLNKEIYVKNNKEGFWIVWRINNKETRSIFNDILGVEIKRIKCHMSIWNKIFYKKHKDAMRRVKHSESFIIKELPEIFIKNFDRGNLEKHESLKDRYYLNDSKIIKTEGLNDKIICYRYVFIVKGNDIILISKHRRK